jgi:transketolase
MSEISTRDAFGKMLVELGDRIPNLYTVDLDLSGATRTKEFAQKFPKRAVQLGIRESHGFGFAAGLALEGNYVVVSTFGAFTEVGLNVLRNSGAYNRACGLIVVGTHAGLAIGKDGATQMGTRDLAAMRTMPGVEIYHPSDDVETKAIMEHIFTDTQREGPVYLRLCRQPLPRVNEDGYMFKPGEVVQLREGNDTLIYTRGGLTHVALAAAQLLESSMGISAGVVNVPSVHPFDIGAQQVADQVGSYSHVITFEDHSVVGGLGDMVAAAVMEKVPYGQSKPQLVKVGIPKDHFGESGDPGQLYARYGLDQHGLVSRVREALIQHGPLGR